MTGYDYYRIGVDAATLILVPGAGILYKLMSTIRHNDMVHLDAKLETVDSGIKRVEASTIRVEDKLDAHLNWHLNQKDK